MSMSVATARDLDVDVGADAIAWTLALSLFGVGDLATTAWGFRLGYVEANPVLALALGSPSIVALAVAKALGFVAAWVVWKATSSRTWAVPGTLAVSGALIVAWNLAVLTGTVGL